MKTATLYLFSDACPSDWLTDGNDDFWHTIVCFVFQVNPALQILVENDFLPHEVLKRDSLHKRMFKRFRTLHSSGTIRKWSTGPAYRKGFISTYSIIQNEFKPIVSALSFQEKTLRMSKQALLNSYNGHLGGMEGRGIGFEVFTDSKGRNRLKHSYVDFFGYHEFQALENQMLVLLLMSWFIADQYIFYWKEIVENKRYGFDELGITVISDKLSGDDDVKRVNENNLRWLIDPEGYNHPIKLTRSPKSDTYFGDLLADNLAGWLNSVISAPLSSYAHSDAFKDTNAWKGWYELTPSATTLNLIPAIQRIHSAE